LRDVHVIKRVVVAAVEIRANASARSLEKRATVHLKRVHRSVVLTLSALVVRVVNVDSLAPVAQLRDGRK